MKFRIKYAQQVVGFFLLASVLALVVVLVFMGANQRWFARNYTFFSRFSSAEGITAGMSVRLKGFEIGKVSRVQLNNFNRVRVEVSIFEDYYPKILPDSVLELSVSPIGLGSGSMNLLPGKKMLPPMEEGSFLPSSDSSLGKTLMAEGMVDKPQGNEAIAGIINQIEPLLATVRTTLQSVEQLTRTVNAGLTGTGKGPNQVSSILNEAYTTLAAVDKLLSNADQTLTVTTANTNTLLVSGQELMKNLNGISGNVENLTSQLQDPKGLVPKLLDPQGSLKTFLDDKNEIYNQITDILTQVNKTLGEVKGLTAYLNRSTPTISGLMEDTKTTIKKTGDVMEGLSNNPLLKGGIPETKAQTSTVRGRRDEDFQ